MTLQKTVSLGAIGVIFQFTILENGIAVNIASAGVKQFIFRKPVSDTDLTVSGSFYTNGTDGILQYTTVSGDLNEVGLWTVQANLSLGGFYGKTDTTSFIVVNNL